MKNWGNINDYLDWRGDLTMLQSSFNVVDGLILSTFSYVNFAMSGQDPILFKDTSIPMDQLPSEDKFKGLSIMKEKTLQFITDAADTKRFGSLLLLDQTDIFHEETQEQFSALSILLPDDTIFISYRGTDNTLIGWKEDFNMAFINGIPSQKSAARYAASILEKYQKPLRLGGHSKGGNLAVWAASHLPQASLGMLSGVYNYDGPGFLPEFIESEEYLRIHHKIFSFVPDSSIVGVLMGHCDYLTIKSTTHSIMQHDPFSWKILGTKFDYDIERSKSGRKLEKSINEIIGSMSPDEIKHYVESIYSILKSTDVKTLDDVEKNKLHHLFFTLPKLIKETRKDLPFPELFS